MSWNTSGSEQIKTKGESLAITSSNAAYREQIGAQSLSEHLLPLQMKNPTRLPEELKLLAQEASDLPARAPGCWEEDTQTAHGSPWDVEEGKVLTPGTSSTPGPTEVERLCVKPPSW